MRKFNTRSTALAAASALAIAAGFGWASTGLVGSALAFGGLIIWAWAMWDAKRTPPA